MNERYEEARMEVVNFNALDVITTSRAADQWTDSETSEWIPRENEGNPDYNAFIDL